MTNKCSDCGNALTAEAEISRLKKLLHEVPDDIEDWGAYASEYFRAVARDWAEFTEAWERERR